MAEAAAFDIRRLLLVGGIVLVLVITTLVFFFRGCAPSLGGRTPGFTVVYSNLELKDAANVIARLKELAIPYEIRENGRSIAVPKEKADQARLSLAEKNLPAGGVVGWEIFDESRLGATDFDRRIQLIRAISGELSRTIRRIEGIDDVRVQIVIPETKLFAATSSPVTASVMIRLRPGFELSRDKIKGIVHLAASSVENLQPENVTVIDDTGNILSAKSQAETQAGISAPPPATEVVTLTPAPTAETKTASVEVVLKKESPPSRESTAGTPDAVLTKVASLTAEERVLLKVQAKKGLEQDLSAKAQELLNRFFPTNSVIVKVSVDIKPLKEAEVSLKDLKIKRLYAVILVDNRINLSAKLKKSTFATTAAAIGYNKKRGDRIVLQSVPFHLATPPEVSTKEAAGSRPPVTRDIGKIFVSASIRNFFWLGAFALLISGLVFVFNRFRQKKETSPAPFTSPPIEKPVSPQAGQRVSMVDQIKSMADRNPEKIAELLKNWLSE